MSLARYLVETGHGDYWAAWSILRDQVSRTTGRGDDYERIRQTFCRRLDRSYGNGVRRVYGRQSFARQIGEYLILPYRRFGFLANIRHRADTLQGIFALGRFSCGYRIYYRL